MAQILVRKLDDKLKEQLRARARSNGRSLEAEVRAILTAATTNAQPTAKGLGTRISARFKGIGLKEDEEIGELRGDWGIKAAVLDP